MTYTINPNGKNAWIRDNADTMDLSVQTNADTVYLNNGRTVEQELGEGYMVSNITTVDSFMSKVIDETLDGAYESCVLKGKTLVNNMSICNCKLTNTSVHKIPFSKTMDVTKSYLLKFRINELPTWSDSSPTSRAIKIEWYNGSVSGGYWSYGKDSITVGTNYYRIIKPYTGEVTSTSFVLWSDNLASGTLDIDVMIVEYQEGMENWDIPYFEGICDVKMPILRNVNMLDKEHIDYKTNILSTSEDIILRGIENVKDTYNALTGEYIQHIGEREYQIYDEFNTTVVTDMTKTQYVISNPITTVIEPIGIPFAYANGHVILESGCTGQSLLPALKYSTVINRTGQIVGIGKTLLKQEKQLTNLEKVLIQSVIGLDYNNALMTLNLEINEVI